MNINDWLTVKQAASRLEISVQAVHGLCQRGALASTYVGRSRFVGKASLQLFMSDPRRPQRSRAKSSVIPAADSYTVEELEALGQGSMEEEWSGVNPPLLSVEARRLYDASPLGQRDARLRADRQRGEV